ncbi:LptF/LptG family permease [Entomospira entomophila]|uniref:LptF/LptG family permease n=1 Tax=Entomospira entomophila TaxID=2719988 RepID=A0A968GDR2_9SPIO|nr:LptF/LptG family permease [Entomospira entomophilus]NIZ41154.1 LptF/LptG family permease [Entomospira entomophilus]WDI35361.1 LptF/LptG family permease [Entomospira entomophilus]
MSQWHSSRLYRYLLGNLAFLHLVFTLLFLLVVLLSNVWYFAPEWLRLGISIKHILVMVLFFVPGALLQSTAIALTMAFWVGYGRLQFFKEIDAMRTLGFSSYQIFRPLLHYALVWMILISLTAFILYPFSMHMFKDYYTRVLTLHVSVQKHGAQKLGETLFYISSHGSEWVISSHEDGYQRIIWAYQSGSEIVDDVRILTAEEVEILLVDAKNNGKQWHWGEAKNFFYPLVFDINTQSYNPYDLLLLKDLWQEALRLWHEYQDILERYQQRRNMLEEVLLIDELPSGERYEYELELINLQKNPAFTIDMVSLLFVVLLRFSHISLIVGLAILAYVLLEYRQMQRWMTPIAIWIGMTALYWVSFYLISFRVLRLLWHPYALLIPIIIVYMINLTIGMRIWINKRRGGVS